MLILLIIKFPTVTKMSCGSQLTDVYYSSRLNDI
jgi:hypothetical protein